MAPPKRYWVKVKVPSEYLSKLPKFEPPISKSRLKKIAAEEKKLQSNGTANGSKTASPQPENNLNYKINLGLKEMSTSGLTMNPITGNYPLDRSGKPARKWVKRQHQFKTFSGFKVQYEHWSTSMELTKQGQEDDEKISIDSIDPVPLDPVPLDPIPLDPAPLDLASESESKPEITA